MCSRRRVLIATGVLSAVLGMWQYTQREPMAATPRATPRHIAMDQSALPIRVSSPLAGVVSAVYVTANTNVRKGEVLALIGSPELQARLDAAKADLEMERSAEVNAENAQEDLQDELDGVIGYRSGIEAKISGVETPLSQSIDDAQQRQEAAAAKVTQARADVERCERAVAIAEAPLEQQKVLAPVDGRVTAVHTRIGQYVESGPQSATLFEVAPGDPK